MVKWVILCCQEKPLASHAPPVPQTDSGDQVENTKAIEQTMVKELGKMPPYLREKGDPNRQHSGLPALGSGEGRRDQAQATVY